MMMITDQTAWLCFLAGSAVVCFALFGLTARLRLKMKSGKAVTMAALSMGLSILTGLIGAKLLYFLFRISYIFKTGFWNYLFSLRPDELSYYGGAAGVCFGVFLAAKIMKEKPGKMLNAFAASGALLAALARFAEYWLGSIGTGDYLEEALPFPFAVYEAWNPDFPEYYVAVFMLEGIIYLRIAVFALCNRKDRLCFLRTVFYLCLTQIICESARAASIRWLFVRYEQLLCYLIAEGILVGYAIAGHKQKKRNWGAAAFGLVVCALTVLEEFMLDGKITLGEIGLPSIVIYAVMGWGLFELAVFEHAARRRLE